MAWKRPKPNIFEVLTAKFMLIATIDCIIRVFCISLVVNMVEKENGA